MTERDGDNLRAWFGNLVQSLHGSTPEQSMQNLADLQTYGLSPVSISPNTMIVGGAILFLLLLMRR